MTLIIFLVGYAWGWRFIAGAFVAEVTNPRRGTEPFDYFMGAMIGFMFGWTWPALVAGRMGYVAYKKFWPSDKNESVAKFFYPAPKPILTRAEKQKAKERKQRESIEAQRKTINERERELQMELTRW
jgi:hypothetical protein